MDDKTCEAVKLAYKRAVTKADFDAILKQYNIKMMKNRLKSRVKMMDRRFRDPRRDQIMRDRERWELRNQKNRRTKKD